MVSRHFVIPQTHNAAHPTVSFVFLSALHCWFDDHLRALEKAAIETLAALRQWNISDCWLYRKNTKGKKGIKVISSKAEAQVEWVVSLHYHMRWINMKVISRRLFKTVYIHLIIHHYFKDRPHVYKVSDLWQRGSCGSAGRVGRLVNRKSQGSNPGYP